MGKRLISQRSGKGSHTFIAKHKGVRARYLGLSNELLIGEVSNLVKDTGRHAIIAEISFDNGLVEYLPAAEGVFIGKKIQQGEGAIINIGNISNLASLPEGCPIYNIEKVSGDGGTLVKSAGNYALIMAKDSKKATIKLPSGKMLVLPLNCRATIGNISCGGKGDKPFIKAGKKFFLMKAKHKMYPRVRGVKMNAVDHPFGGAGHHAGKSKSTSRNAPPGRKVGAIASKRTGRKKKN